MAGTGREGGHAGYRHDWRIDVMNEETFRLVEAGGIAQRNVARDAILKIMKTNVENFDMERASVLTKVATGLASSRTLRELLIPDPDDCETFMRTMERAKL